MCSCNTAALFKVFLEVVTSCVCCLEACKLRYFWPQPFKNIPGGQTLNCVMMSRGESAIASSFFFSPKAMTTSTKACLDLQLKSHGGQDPEMTAGSWPPPHLTTRLHFLCVRVIIQVCRLGVGRGRIGLRKAGHSSGRGRRRWRQSGHVVMNIQRQSCRPFNRNRNMGEGKRDQRWEWGK